jgi:hypothetical protein
MTISRSKKNILTGLQLLVVAFGLMRLFGDTFRIKTLDQIGFGSGFSPLPLVFSDREGVEDFAHVMKIDYTTLSGLKKSTVFDQAFYSNIQGPIFLVGTYSVAIAYSPRFPETLWRPVLEYGFCKGRTLALAMNEKESIRSVEINIHHLEKAALHWKETITCAP